MKTEKCRIKKEFVIFTSETNGRKMKHIFGAHSNVSIKILTKNWRDNPIVGNFHIFFFKSNTFVRFFSYKISQLQIQILKMFMVFNLKQANMRSKKQTFCVCSIILKRNTYQIEFVFVEKILTFIQVSYDNKQWNLGRIIA